jgi:serine/threonine protein kinase
MLQLALAFTYLHQQGVYHQDVKPENILLSERGSVKVSNIDCARSRDLAP